MKFPIRCRLVIDRPAEPTRDYILYWMTSARRLAWSFALDRAVDWAIELGRPLVIFEPLRCDYPWASDRLHRFIIDGMADHDSALAGRGVTYYPYVEPARGHARGLLAALARRAAVVVTDEYPAFFLPRMLAAAAPQLAVRLEAVDGNGLVPMRAPGRVFLTAHSFRAYLQRTLRDHLKELPSADPLSRAPLAPPVQLPRKLLERWPRADDVLLGGNRAGLAALPIDHGVPPVVARGGMSAAQHALARFIERGLPAYAEGHSHPDLDVTSRLSPYLHFGHAGAHQVFAAVMTAERWTTRRLSPQSRGSREGWWGIGAGAEAFLDQLVTWRELGFNMHAMRPDCERYESLPAWAAATLARHASDRRPHLYSLAQLEGAETHDEVWNAAQRQMVAEGWFHNYLRMIWGKKILEWSRTPQEALGTMIALMNRHALDGRDPNTGSGIFWTFGRYDRPWGPERPIFGTVRYMSSESARRKLKMKSYLARWSRQVASDR
jgi:deoxyribodipyrimidine photo-lyase